MGKEEIRKKTTTAIELLDFINISTKVMNDIIIVLKKMEFGKKYLMK